MRYTVAGYSQRELLRRHLDAFDAVLLQYVQETLSIVSIDGSDRCTKVLIDNELWVSIPYEEVVEQLPVLGLSSADALYRRLRKLVASGALISRYDSYHKCTLLRLNSSTLHILICGGAAGSHVPVEGQHT